MTVPGAVTAVTSMVTSAFTLLTAEPVIYFVGAALLVVSISVAKKLIPMKRG